jgi:UDP-4-amino-4,6-dideoxy-N-acetyl-beta-L-altrosamine transaminase
MKTTPTIPYSRQCIGMDDIRAVTKVLRSDWITQGPAVSEFEVRFAKFVGARHAVAFSSGTAALHASCHVSGVGLGDEVVVPPITFVATANAVTYLGGTPRFADVDAETALLEPKAAEASLTRRTRAIIVVDYAGHPCDLEAFRALARKRGVTLIEDAAHSLGAQHRGRRVGSQADLSIFSFHPVKHITTGEGGMVTTDRPELAQRLQDFRQHGITKEPARMSRNDGPWYYEMTELGYNYRLTDFQCALGTSQLKKVESFVRARRSAAEKYADSLASVEELSLPVERPWARHAYHLYPVRVREELLRGGRRALFERLRERGLGVQVHYIPVYWHPYYQEHFGTRLGACPRAEQFYRSEISLPLFPQIRASEQARTVREVVAAVRDLRVRSGKGRKATAKEAR